MADYDLAIQEYLLSHSVDDLKGLRDTMELIKVTEETTGEPCYMAKIRVLKQFPSLPQDHTVFYPLLDKINEYLAKL